MLLTIHNMHVISDQEQLLDIVTLTEWKNLKTSLPKRCANDLNFNHYAYTNSYINLVTETHVSLGEHFFTEKVYKPLAVGQFFILIAPPGSIAVLKSMGFDTFDDIIDHSRYDYISDWRERIDAIHELLDELYFLNWEELYNRTYKRRMANIKLFYSGDPVRPYGIELAEKMSRIGETSYVYNDAPIKNLFESPTLISKILQCLNIKK